MLKATYASLDDVPENFRELYEERGGIFHIAKIDGIKTDADVSRVQRSLEAERTTHNQLKSSVSGFLGDKKFDDIQSILDRVPELELAAAGKLDPAKIDELTETRVRTKLAPVERELSTLRTQLGERDQMIAAYKAKDVQRAIHDHVRAEAVKLKVVPSAQEDILMLAERIFEVGEDGKVTVKDGVGSTPGVTADIWLGEMQTKRPHWWPASVGGGAGGSGAAGALSTNPWTDAGWNMTEQGRIVRELGEAKAKQMAQAAGTTLGGKRPVKK